MQLLFHLVYGVGGRTNTQHHPHGHPNHIVPRFNVHIPLGIGPLHPIRIDTHWWLPLQFCVLLLKMDTNRVRNM